MGDEFTDTFTDVSTDGLRVLVFEAGTVGYISDGEEVGHKFVLRGETVGEVEATAETPSGDYLVVCKEDSDG